MKLKPKQYAYELELAERIVLLEVGRIGISETRKELFYRNDWPLKPIYEKALFDLTERGDIGRIGDRYFPMKWMKE